MKVSIKWAKLLWDVGVPILFILLGMFNLGISNIAAAIDFMWAGWFIGRIFRTVVVIGVIKK